MRTDQSEWMNSEDAKIDLKKLKAAVRPLLWRVLVVPVQPRSMSKGGIALPDAAMDGEAHMNYIGRVVALGPLAGKSEKFANPEWTEKSKAPRYLWDVKEGDWVVFSRYAGQRKEFNGVKLLTVNDDEILDVIDGPEGFRIYV